MKAPKLKDLQIVRVTWKDSCAADPGWLSKKAAIEEANLSDVVSVGFVVYSDKKRLTLAGSYTEYGDDYSFNEIQTTPWANIIKVEKL
jgi:hypothetical protein